jgi:bifunctional DNA-binding transcriptional regulator/antitoxin component of YhaV-PrlF toxin-antitoxin module
MTVNQTAYVGKKRSGKKRIKVSEKRQITIPIDFYKALELEDEVDCQLHGDAIVIGPVQEHGCEFDEQTLAELIAKDYSGQELLNKFKETGALSFFTDQYSVRLWTINTVCFWI